MKAVWTSLATDDLLDIWGFIANDSLEAADRVADEIAAACDQLAGQPGLGARRDALGRDVRGFRVRNYLIFYREHAGEIVVLRVLHGARDIEGLF